MKKNKSFLEAVKNAFNGMRYFFLHEINGIIQLAIAALAIALAVGLKISTTEWLLVVVCIGFVIGLEMINTAIENLCNVVQEEYHPIIKIVKDVAAAAVMWTAIVSVIIGLIIFLPKIF
jgi:diacylglycerol kinase